MEVTQLNKIAKSFIKESTRYKFVPVRGTYLYQYEVNPLTPRRTQVSPFTEISILF